jgi:1-acyl-sn-glycerol-3-phosphate acyltransferase
MSLPASILLENPARFDGTGLDRRDPAYIRELLPLLELLYRRYFRVTATGLENLPASGPAVVVGNHSGGVMTPDTSMTLHAWMTARGVETPVYGLAHPAFFRIPYLNVHAMKIGAIRAHPRQAMEALDREAIVLVYPGGADEVYRSFRRRNEVDLMGRTGFIKLAVRYGAPIVPVVAAGGHETLIVLDDGARLARRLGLDRRGLPCVPVSLSWPWGLTVGVTSNVPFPARIDIRVGEPIELGGVTSADLRDRRVLRDCYERVESRMQQMLDELVAGRAGGRRATGARPGERPRHAPAPTREG